MNWINDLGAGLTDAGKSVGDWTTDATKAVGVSFLSLMLTHLSVIGYPSTSKLLR